MWHRTDTQDAEHPAESSGRQTPTTHTIRPVSFASGLLGEYNQTPAVSTHMPGNVVNNIEGMSGKEDTDGWDSNARCFVGEQKQAARKVVPHCGPVFGPKSGKHHCRASHFWAQKPGHNAGPFVVSFSWGVPEWSIAIQGAIKETAMILRSPSPKQAAGGRLWAGRIAGLQNPNCVQRKTRDSCP